MTIRTVQEQDYEELVKLYASFFKTHNRFQQEKDKVIAYLKEQAEKNQLIVDEELKGALFLVNFGQDAEGTHKLWKFRHFAFENEEVAAELLTEAEKIIQEKSKTIKIELTIAETEEGIEFYKQHGYEQEGELKNHFRWGESCFVLSKSIS